LFSFSVGIVVYGAYLLYIYYESPEQQHIVTNVGMGLGTILLGLVCVVVSAIYGYFVEVFYRDYLFLKEQNAMRECSPVRDL
jgi:hypothetical protein